MKKKPKFGDEMLEWACYGLMQDNERLKKTIIYQKAIIDALEKRFKKKPEKKG